MKRKLNKYTAEYKSEAIQLALKSPCITTTAKELGIPAATLHTWIHALKVCVFASKMITVSHEDDH